MKSKAKRATKAEQERMARLKEMPCIACAQNLFAAHDSETECHHLLSGNKRRGHLYTVPLCQWHHRGDPRCFTASQMELLMGPSLARSSKAFHAAFGSDEELLRRTNQMLEINT